MPITQSTHGFDGLAYVGSAFTPAVEYFQPRDPVPKDQVNIPLGTIWLNTTNQNIWMLVDKLYNPIVKKVEGTWVQVNGDEISQIDTDAGSALPILGIVNVVGGTGINTAGAGNTVTVNVSAAVANQYTSDAGVATPVANNLNVLGGVGIDTTGVGDTLTINLHGGIAGQYTTDAGVATPALGNLNITTQLATLGCGSSVSFSAPGAADTVQLNVTDALANTIVGHLSGHAGITGTNNAVFGDSSALHFTTADDNTIVGHGAGGLVNTGWSNILIGSGAGSGFTNGAEHGNILIGHAGHALAVDLVVIDTGVNISGVPFIHNYPGGISLNTFFGNAGNLTLTGAPGANTGVGLQSLKELTTGTANTALGKGALWSVTSGSQNIGIGIDAAFNSAGGTGLTTGNFNIVIGYTAASSWTGAESNNICIATIGKVGESNTIRIGTFEVGETLQTKCFIGAIRGRTTDAADAIPVLISSTGQLGTISSSARVKDDIEDMGPHSDMIMALRPVTFTYKSDSSKRKQYGLIAEEVKEVFPALVCYDEDGLPETVRYHELPVLILNEFQKYAVVIQGLQQRIAELEKLIH